MTDVHVTTRKEDELCRFLEMNGFAVEDLGGSVFRVTRDDELPVFLNVDENTLYFEVDLGNFSQIADKDFYFKLLDRNTEILPVSFGINNTNPDDPRLVLVESRVTGDLNDQEVLSVFDALELAVDKAEEILGTYVQ
ncbi:MAG: hypothetical protein GY868_04375 [Deltaproteobacteria bacterium]|nr:hypothetical protein [Deltaproteobacteria bacterium]